MKGINHLELMPEPEEPNLLTAVDIDAPGYPGEAYGISDEEARELRWPFGPIIRFLWPWGAVGFSSAIVTFILLYPSIAPLLGEVLPDSEWAFEDSGIRNLQDNANFGEGTRVCIVDTGIDISHPDFERINLVGFRDFYADNSNETRDIGDKSHGTLMAGLLVANESFIGAAPGVSLSVAIALGPSGKSSNERMVSQAIRWCRISQNADIISLSLGSEPGSWVSSSSETIEAVNEALNEGIFIVAAAGNSDPESNNSDVSTPASIEGVISVGAHGKDGNPWKDSATGSDIDPFTGDERVYPNQKPEILAPGVLLWSCISSEYEPPYAYSSGTSDSTVLVTGALALILNVYGSIIAGENGRIDSHEMSLVKVALAKSARDAPNQVSSHDSKIGYGLLDAEEWANQVALEFGVEQQ
ncbi:MAG: S8 family serine peptidase [Candidatus Thermoplasmatota archaeon]|nr:S8 family serine peptidase [Candidatus Thermoplasmatota archaeon]